MTEYKYHRRNRIEENLPPGSCQSCGRPGNYYILCHHCYDLDVQIANIDFEFSKCLGGC